MNVTGNFASNNQHWSVCQVPMLLYYGAHPYVSVGSHQKIQQLKHELLPRSPYSPDLALTDYHVSPVGQVCSGQTIPEPGRFDLGDS
ncbi:hypothetical protein TNIN_274341 [Trichonephila inaurata madagascariensis]|uniref:Uncharacterized protein n=1 Tax=Trichonephila inaurata madagascariensis TaxID=2747483 RepID=A0A8X6XTC9_9ARAC|nr:hypothetical protein TNIN_274341 [Trichonephila inaurata madagascariensis]